MLKKIAYPIIHIALNKETARPKLDLSYSGHYLVFWWKHIPLGHLLLDNYYLLTDKDYYDCVIYQISAAIKMYCNEQNIVEEPWQDWLTNQQIEKWCNWMDRLLAKWTVHVAPFELPISVIVCTRNRPSFLKACLQSLQKLLCVPKQIIVVDNDPAEASSFEVAAQFDGVIYIREQQGGLSNARNTGIKAANSPIVAFTDDDATVDPLWLYRVWETFNDPSIVAMTGLVLSSQMETEAQIVFERYWSFNRGFVDKYFGKAYFDATYKNGTPVSEIGAGVNTAFRKSIFNEVGFFDVRLGAGASGCNEDSEIWFRILLKGHSICYNPRAIVYHEHRSDMNELKKQLFSYMRGYTAAALIQQQQHRKSGYYKKIFLQMPRYYLHLLKAGFPRYSFRYQTVGVELKGIISGFCYFLKNRKITNNY